MVETVVLTTCSDCEICADRRAASGMMRRRFDGSPTYRLGTVSTGILGWLRSWWSGPRCERCGDRTRDHGWTRTPH